VLAENNYASIKQSAVEVAVLPLGATEPHNLHLPYGTDFLEATMIGEQICEFAHRQGAKVMLLPTIPYGTETNMREFPLAINLNPSTLHLVIRDIIASLVGNGIHKIVLLNSHGGNEIKPLLREFYGTSPAQLFLCNWYQSISDIYFEIFERSDDHAGEMETSFALAFFPQWVGVNEEGRVAADSGEVNKSRFDAVNNGWISISRPWHLLTTNSGSGNPHSATKEKGLKLMEVLTSRIGSFLVELSSAKIDRKFPY